MSFFFFHCRRQLQLRVNCRYIKLFRVRVNTYNFIQATELTKLHQVVRKRW